MKEAYMRDALDLAKKAFDENEVPVGALVVCNGEVIASAYNERELGGDATAHAEVLAIRRACERLGRWRLSDCELYVTLEPCPMCAGAIVNAKLGAVYYGAKDPRGGAFGSIMDLRAYPLYHRPTVYGGILEDEALSLMRAFFEKKRKEKN